MKRGSRRASFSAINEDMNEHLASDSPLSTFSSGLRQLAALTRLLHAAGIKAPEDLQAKASAIASEVSLLEASFAAVLPQPRKWDALPGTPIDLARVAVVLKDSKVQYDAARLGVTESALREVYRREGADEAVIFESHEAQQLVARQLEDALGSDRVIRLNTADADVLSKLGPLDAVIAAGGDNHFQRVAQLLHDGALLAGINTDPARSAGKLLGWTGADIGSFLEDLRGGRRDRRRHGA